MQKIQILDCTMRDGGLALEDSANYVDRDTNNVMKKDLIFSASKQLLDCTLRDGGFMIEDSASYLPHINLFSKSDCSEIASLLYDAGVDIIEIGAVEISNTDKTGFAIYQNIESISRAIPQHIDKTKCAVLYRGPDTPVDDIPAYSDSLCKKVRVIIRYSELKKSIDFCMSLSQKGYEVFIQPMVTLRYTADEIDYMIKASNDMGAYALYFVDSYGYMTEKEVKMIFEKYDSILDKKIRIGFHSHNNIDSAFANVRFFLANCGERDVIVDSTCMGMGQGAGNMQTEIIADYLNKNYGKNYNYENILDVCEIVEKFDGDNLWGYSPMYLIPAINKTAYKFSVALRKKYHLRYSEIYNILKNIPEDLRHRYSTENIQKLFEISGYSGKIKE